MMSTYFVDLSL